MERIMFYFRETHTNEDGVIYYIPVYTNDILEVIQNKYREPERSVFLCYKEGEFIEQIILNSIASIQ